MYKIETPSTINRIVALYYGLRVWNRNEDTFILATLLTLFQAIFFVLFVTSVIVGAAIAPDMQEVVFLTDFAILTGTHTVRLLYIVWKKEEIRQFIEEIGTHCTDDVGEFVRVKSKISALMKFAEIFVLACSADVSLIIVHPIFSSSEIINIALPWKKSRLVFWIKHIIVSVGCVYSIIWFLFSVIIWFIMLNCSLKYQMLGDQLTNMGKTAPKGKELKVSSLKQHASCEEDLLKAIKTHRKIRR